MSREAWTRPWGDICFDWQTRVEWAFQGVGISGRGHWRTERQVFGCWGKVTNPLWEVSTQTSLASPSQSTSLPPPASASLSALSSPWGCRYCPWLLSAVFLWKRKGTLPTPFPLPSAYIQYLLSRLLSPSYLFLHKSKPWGAMKEINIKKRKFDSEMKKPGRYTIHPQGVLITPATVRFM